MVKQKISFRQKMNTKKFIFIFFSMLILYQSCIWAENEGDIKVSLSCLKEQTDVNEQSKSQYVSFSEARPFDPLILKLIIANDSTTKKSVLWPEFPAGTLTMNLHNQSNGKHVTPQVKWSISLSSDYIDIQTGKNIEVLLYLEEPFPLGIPSGKYNLSLQYTPDYQNWFQTNTVSFIISPQSEEEKKQLEDYIKVMQTGGYEYTLKYGEEFLSKYPTSRFRSDVYLEMAREYTNTYKKYETARNMLDMAISDKSSTTYNKGIALYKKARLLKDKMGKNDEAIDCLEKSQLRWAKKEVEQWKKEKDSQTGK